MASESSSSGGAATKAKTHRGRRDNAASPSVIKVPKRTAALISSLTDNVSSEAEAIVSNTWPEKILRLHQLLEHEAFRELTRQEVEATADLPTDTPSTATETASSSSTTTTASSPAAPSGKRRRGAQHDDVAQAAAVGTGDASSVDYTTRAGGKEGPGPVVSSNSHVMRMMELLSKEVRDAVTDIGKVKLWISLMVPKIESGNAFGVEVRTIQRRHRRDVCLLTRVLFLLFC